MKFDSNIPLYLQLKEEIEKSIISEVIKDNESIPSIRTLAQQFRLNPQTVSNAFNELLNENLLYKKRGIGMFVQKGAKEKLLEKNCRKFRETEFSELVRKGFYLGISKKEMNEIIDSIYKTEVK